MTNLPERLRLKALAEEDIYFARRDRELIEALHRRKLAKHLKIHDKKKRKKAKSLEKEYKQATVNHGKRLKKLARHYRKLIKKALKLA